MFVLQPLPCLPVNPLWGFSSLDEGEGDKIPLPPSFVVVLLLSLVINETFQGGIADPSCLNLLSYSLFCEWI